MSMQSQTSLAHVEGSLILDLTALLRRARGNFKITGASNS